LTSGALNLSYWKPGWFAQPGFLILGLPRVLNLRLDLLTTSAQQHPIREEAIRGADVT
jgi:hypothetical protein